MDEYSTAREGPSAGGAEPRLRGVAEPGDGALRSAGSNKRYSAAEKLAVLREHEASGEEHRPFCARVGLSTATLCKWRRLYAEGGEAALADRPNPRNGVKGAARRRFTSDQRRQMVEAYEKSGMTLADFAVLWGVSKSGLSKWLTRYRAEGLKGLEDRPHPGVAEGGLQRRLSAQTRTEIVRTKARFPTFGLRKVRDFLLRFHGVKVSAGSVRNTLREAGVEPPAKPRRKPKRKPLLPRRFERARPGQMWQSDITSFVLRRHSQRVYLTVFMDDHSRYVVAFGLEQQQRQELVTGALLEGIARFGKPEEVLTDQGRQYVSWRGKSAFRKLLDREGIAHVVSRTHHPQTLGKCERFWKTVNEEFWLRAKPEDLADARERLGHFIAHYNHFRPHQGIDGLVPADRFFGAEPALRAALEAEMEANELARAVDAPPRKPVFLFGQIGDQQVSVHGERGRLVIHTPDGGRQEMNVEELGLGTEARSDADRGHDSDERDDRDGTEAAQAPWEEAPGLQGPGPHGTGGAGAVASGERGGEGEGAQPVRFGAGVLAGPHVEAGPLEAARHPATAGVAALAAGALGYAGGPAQATEGERNARDGSDPARRRSEGPAQANQGAGTPAQADGGSGDDPAGSPSQPPRSGGGGAPQTGGGVSVAGDEEDPGAGKKDGPCVCPTRPSDGSRSFFGAGVFDQRGVTSSASGGSLA